MRFTPNPAKISQNAQDTDITNAALPEDRKHWYRREVKSQKACVVSFCLIVNGISIYAMLY